MAQVSIVIKLVSDSIEECISLKGAVFALVGKYDGLHLSIQSETIPEPMGVHR